MAGNKQIKAVYANNEYPIYGYDGGNERAKTSTILPKALRSQDSEEEGSFIRNSIQLNAVANLTKREYDQAVTRRKGQRPDYGFLHLHQGREDFFFAIGDSALPYIRDIANERKMNKAKYTPHYYGVQFIRGLTVIHNGNLPTDLHVIAGHPPLNAEKAGDIENSLKGKWVLDFMGEKQEINIHSVRAVDEIFGAALNLRLKVDGTENGRALTVNRGKTLGIDLGGGTLDKIYIDEKGFPVQGTLASAEVGIFNAIMEFKLTFDDRPEYAGALGDSTSGIPLEKVYEIFRDSHHRLLGGGLKGGELDCKALFEEVMQGELNRIYAMTKKMVGTISVAADQIVILGGAGDLLFNELAESVFPEYAENGRLFRGGGILGASIGMAKFGQLIRRAEQRKLKEAGNG